MRIRALIRYEQHFALRRLCPYEFASVAERVYAITAYPEEDGAW